jgi:serine/threonine-protein phosphatase 2B catalytic subunit
MPRIEAIKDHLVNEGTNYLHLETISSVTYPPGRISKAHFKELLFRVTRIFTLEENIVPVAHPTTVCGDVHGQFYDLIKLLRIGGDPANTTYLWLGDYVDRGRQSQ